MMVDPLRLPEEEEELSLRILVKALGFKLCFGGEALKSQSDGGRS